MTDEQWTTFTEDLNGRTNLSAIQQTYQDAYDRYVSGETANGGSASSNAQ